MSGGQGRILVGLTVEVRVVKIDENDEKLSELVEVSLDEVDEISETSVVDFGVEESDVLCSSLSVVIAVVKASVTAVDSVDFVKSRTSTVVGE